MQMYKCECGKTTTYGSEAPVSCAVCQHCRSTQSAGDERPGSEPHDREIIGDREECARCGQYLQRLSA